MHKFQAKFSSEQDQVLVRIDMKHPFIMQATRALHTLVRACAMVPLLPHHFIDDEMH